MRSKREQDYITRHAQIRNRLLELVKTSERACFEVAKLASELGMDQRTVRSHLKIMELDNCGLFVDPGEKSFCPKEGIALLAQMIKLNEHSNDDRNG